jgi:hypothetical protein
MSAFTKAINIVARVLVHFLILAAALCGNGGAADIGIDSGDEIARGQRAMAVLGSCLLLATTITCACFVGIWGQMLDFQTLLGVIFASVGVALWMYVALDRRIARAELARNEAAQAQKSPSSLG